MVIPGTKKFIGVCALLFVSALAPSPTRARQASSRSFAAQAAAKKPAEEPPTVDQIVARCIRALGGEQALKKITSRTMKGKFEAPAQQVTGEAEILAVAPDRFYARVTIPDEGEIISAYDGTVAWASDSQSGVRDMKGREAENMRRSSQFQHELRFHEIFPQARVLEKSTDEDRAVWVIEATPTSGSPEKFYFDAETGLMVRHDMIQVTLSGELAIEQRYSDYAAVDGVLVPRIVRHKDPEVEWQATFSEIRQNAPIDPARFSKPVAK